MADPAPVPRVALRWPDEVAAALGVSADFIQRNGLACELRVVRRGRVRLVAVAELERWVQAESEVAAE